MTRHCQVVAGHTHHARSKKLQEAVEIVGIDWSGARDAGRGCAAPRASVPSVGAVLFEGHIFMGSRSCA